MTTPLSESSPPSGPSALRVEVAASHSRRVPATLIVLSTVFAVLAVVAVRWLSAAPVIQWSSPSVLEFLLPSESRKLTITFRSTESLSQVDVFVTPGLSSVLSVRPTRLTKIAANKDNKLDLSLTAPASPGVAFEGTIQLKTTQGTSATQSSVLPVKLVVHGEIVPPDPGEAGKLTLEGTDSDGDGVRDDVQRYIVLNHFASLKTIAVLEQYGKAFGDVLLHADNPNADWRRAIFARRCAIYVGGQDRASVYRLDDSVASIKALFLNTEPRSRAYLVASRSRFTLSDSPDRAGDVPVAVEI